MKHQHTHGHVGHRKGHEHAHAHIPHFHGPRVRRAQLVIRLVMGHRHIHVGMAVGRFHRGVHGLILVRENGLKKRKKDGKNKANPQEFPGHGFHFQKVFRQIHYFFQRSFQGWAFNSSTKPLMSSAVFSSLSRTPTTPLPLWMSVVSSFIFFMVLLRSFIAWPTSFLSKESVNSSMLLDTFWALATILVTSPLDLERSSIIFSTLARLE